MIIIKESDSNEQSHILILRPAITARTLFQFWRLEEFVNANVNANQYQAEIRGCSRVGYLQADHT